MTRALNALHHIQFCVAMSYCGSSDFPRPRTRTRCRQAPREGCDGIRMIIYYPFHSETHASPDLYSRALRRPQSRALTSRAHVTPSRALTRRRRRRRRRRGRQAPPRALRGTSLRRPRLPVLLRRAPRSPPPPPHAGAPAAGAPRRPRGQVQVPVLVRVQGRHTPPCPRLMRCKLPRPRPRRRRPPRGPPRTAQSRASRPAPAAGARGRACGGAPRALGGAPAAPPGAARPRGRCGRRTRARRRAAERAAGAGAARGRLGHVRRTLR
jgi:hypothetical protein